MLKLYTEKGNKEKITAIIDEMKRYKQITLIPGKWKQDNRDWFIDKDHNTISQSLSSIKFISKQAAQDLYNLSQSQSAYIGTEYIRIKDKDENGKQIRDENGKPLYEEVIWNADLCCFTNILRALQMNTCLDTRQIEILIGIGYFQEYGENQKLIDIYRAFFEGPNKLTKTIKSFNKRLELIREYEKTVLNQKMPIAEQLLIENENIGLCLSTFENAPSNMFFVQEVDTKYGIKAKLYSVKRGTVGIVRLRKDLFESKQLSPNQCIFIDNGKHEQRYSYKDGRRTPIQGEYDYWLKQYHLAS